MDEAFLGSRQLVPPASGDEAPRATVKPVQPKIMHQPASVLVRRPPVVVQGTLAPGAIQRMRSMQGQHGIQTKMRPGVEAFEVNLQRKSGGWMLPKDVQAKMESALGVDFSNVRIHVGTEAASIGAIAFTWGSDIHFAPGHYNPHSLQGQQLLGHELAHVLQQRAGRVKNPFGSGTAVVHDQALEAEANHLGMKAAMHRGTVRVNRAYLPIQPPAAIQPLFGYDVWGTIKKAAAGTVDAGSQAIGAIAHYGQRGVVGAAQYVGLGVTAAAHHGSRLAGAVAYYGYQGAVGTAHYLRQGARQAVGPTLYGYGRLAATTSAGLRAMTHTRGGLGDASSYIARGIRHLGNYTYAGGTGALGYGWRGLTGLGTYLFEGGAGAANYLYAGSVGAGNYALRGLTGSLGFTRDILSGTAHYGWRTLAGPAAFLYGVPGAYRGSRGQLQIRHGALVRVGARQGGIGPLLQYVGRGVWDAGSHGARGFANPVLFGWMSLWDAGAYLAEGIEGSYQHTLRGLTGPLAFAQRGIIDTVTYLGEGITGTLGYGRGGLYGGLGYGWQGVAGLADFARQSYRGVAGNLGYFRTGALALGLAGTYLANAYEYPLHYGASAVSAPYLFDLMNWTYLQGYELLHSGYHSMERHSAWYETSNLRNRRLNQISGLPAGPGPSRMVSWTLGNVNRANISSQFRTENWHRYSMRQAERQLRVLDPHAVLIRTKPHPQAPGYSFTIQYPGWDTGISHTGMTPAEGERAEYVFSNFIRPAASPNDYFLVQHFPQTVSAPLNYVVNTWDPVGLW